MPNIVKNTQKRKLRNHPDDYCVKLIEELNQVADIGLPHGYSLEKWINELMLPHMQRLRRGIARAYYLPAADETSTARRAQEIDLIKKSELNRRNRFISNRMGIKDLFGEEIK